MKNAFYTENPDSADSSALVSQIVHVLKYSMINGINDEKVMDQLNTLCNALSLFPNSHDSAALLREFLDCDSEEREREFGRIQTHFSTLAILNLQTTLKASPAPGRAKKPDEIKKDGTEKTQLIDTKLLEENDFDLKTPLPAEKIEEARMVLRNDVVDRFEQLKQCYDKGYFQDFRLVDDMLHGLNSESENFGNFVSQKVIPSCGLRYQSTLANRITPKGTAADLRAFQSLYYVSPEKAVRKGLEILDLVPIDFKAEIIFYLSREASCRRLALEHVGHTEKLVSHAAIRGLVYANWAGKQDFFCNLFSQTDHWKGLQWFFERYSNNEIHQIIWEQVLYCLKNIDIQKQTFGQLQLFERTSELILCLHPGFLREMHMRGLRDILDQNDTVQSQPLSDHAWNKSFDSLIASIVIKVTQSTESYGKLILSKLQGKVPVEAFESYFRSCLECMKPDQFYEIFHKYLNTDVVDYVSRRHILLALFDEAVEHEIDQCAPSIHFRGVQWDARWHYVAEKLMEEGELSLATILASSSITGFNAHFYEVCKSEKSSHRDVQFAFFGLLKSGNSDYSAELIQKISETIPSDDHDDFRKNHHLALALMRLSAFLKQSHRLELIQIAEKSREPYKSILFQELTRFEPEAIGAQ